MHTQGSGAGACALSNSVCRRFSCFPHWDTLDFFVDDLEESGLKIVGFQDDLPWLERLGEDDFEFVDVLSDFGCLLDREFEVGLF